MISFLDAAEIMRVDLMITNLMRVLLSYSSIELHTPL